MTSRPTTPRSVTARLNSTTNIVALSLAETADKTTHTHFIVCFPFQSLNRESWLLRRHMMYARLFRVVNIAVLVLVPIVSAIHLSIDMGIGDTFSLIV